MKAGFEARMRARREKEREAEEREAEERREREDRERDLSGCVDRMRREHTVSCMPLLLAFFNLEFIVIRIQVMEIMHGK